MSTSATVSRRVRAVYPNLAGFPVIAAEFKPGEGWTQYRWRKQATITWLRKLRAKGVTAVAISIDSNRAADFQVRELVKR